MHVRQWHKKVHEPVQFTYVRAVGLTKIGDEASKETRISFIE